MELDLMVKERNVNVELPELSEEETKKINKIDELWQDWRRWFESNHKDRVREDLRRVNAITTQYDDEDDMWRGVNGSPIRFALEYAVAETYSARILKGILGTPEVFKILPKKHSKDKGRLEQFIDNAKIMEKVVKHFLEEDNWTQKIIDFVDTLALQSSCPWVVYQTQKKEIIRQAVSYEKPVYDGIGNQVGVEQDTRIEESEQFIDNRPCWNLYNLEDVAFNYTMGRFENSPWYVVRQLIHRSQLSAMYPEYKEIFDSGQLDWDQQYDFLQERAQEIGQSWDTGNFNQEGKIETYYYMEPEGVVVVFGRKIIKEVPNPTKAKAKEVFIGMANLFPVADMPYGRDLVQLTATYSDLWNELINIEVDNAKLSGNMVIKIKTNAGVQMDTIFVGPGNQWLMDDLEAVQSEQLKHTVGTTFGLLKVIGEKDQQIHGATSSTMGTKSDAEFATDINRMQIESNLRFWKALINFRMEFSKIIRAYVKHIQEFIVPAITPGSPLAFLLLGDDGYNEEVEVKDGTQLLGDFTYKISFETEDVDRNVIRAQLLQAVMIISKSPILAPVTNPDKLLEIIFKMFPNVREMEELGASTEQQLTHILSKLSSQQLAALLGNMDQLIKAKQMEEQSIAMKKQGGRGAKPSGGKLDTIPASGSKITSTANRTMPPTKMTGGGAPTMSMVAGQGT